MPYVIVRVDDILVSGETKEAHLSNLEEVLRRLSKASLRLNLKKCSVFLADEVVYLGQRISSAGIQPVEEKVKAVSSSRECNTAETLTLTLTPTLQPVGNGKRNKRKYLRNQGDWCISIAQKR